MDSSDYTRYRPLLFSIAYRMTGSVSDAEDIVQEAYLRATKSTLVATTADAAKATGTRSPKAYLATITTRLAIDHLRSARVRRESYVGTWLPEPLQGDSDGAGLPLADDAPGPAELAETSDSLSMAFLVLLESLAPPNAPCSCSARSSATPTRRSPRRRANLSPPAGKSLPAPAAGSTRGARGWAPAGPRGRS
jgi:RNA polymerase sigma factor (sigma-70 family)